MPDPPRAPVPAVSSIGRTTRCTGAHLSILFARADPSTTVVHVDGDIDALTAPRLSKLLTPTLAEYAGVVVIDLTGVEFLGVAGILILEQAALRADLTGTELRLVTGPRCVDRALRFSSLPARLACHTSLSDAVPAA